MCDNVTITRTGVISSNITGYGKNGAICGAIFGALLDQLYVKKDVKIKKLFSSATSGEEIGGLFGLLGSYNPPYRLTINNSYCQASLESASNKLGGFIGYADIVTSFQLKIINSYSDVTLTSTSGNFIGIQGNTICQTTLDLSNSYFNNENGYPSINKSSCTPNPNALGRNCLALGQAITTNFSSSLWCGASLINGK